MPKRPYTTHSKRFIVLLFGGSVIAAAFIIQFSSYSPADLTFMQMIQQYFGEGYNSYSASSSSSGECEKQKATGDFECSETFDLACPDPAGSRTETISYPAMDGGYEQYCDTISQRVTNHCYTRHPGNRNAYNACVVAHGKVYVINTLKGQKESVCRNRAKELEPNTQCNGEYCVPDGPRVRSGDPTCTGISWSVSNNRLCVKIKCEVECTFEGRCTHEVDQHIMGIEMRCCDETGSKCKDLIDTLSCSDDCAESDRRYNPKLCRVTTEYLDARGNAMNNQDDATQVKVETKRKNCEAMLGCEDMLHMNESSLDMY